MFTRSRSAMLVLLFVTVATLVAGPTPELKDPFLDNLVGNWHVARRFGSGRTVENTVRADWVLDHQFLELHYRDIATPPKYEAMVFIGYNAGEQRYVCHWIDNFGGEFSALGYGKIDSERHAIEFTFNYKDGPSPINSASIRPRKIGDRSCGRKKTADGKSSLKTRLCRSSEK